MKPSQIPELCESCEHLAIGIGAFPEDGRSGGFVGLSVSIRARCMKERSPVDGLCPEYAEREGRPRIES